MKTKKRVSLVILLLIGLVSCRKELVSDRDQSPSFLSEAKNYYYQQARKPSIVSTGTIGDIKSDTESYNKTTRTISPIWKKNYIGKTSKLTFTEVPFVSNLKYISLYKTEGKPADDKINIMRVNASFERLLIYKTASGDFHQLQLTYIPDYEYLKKHSFDASHNQINKLDDDFSGYIEYSSIQEDRKFFVLRFENGSLVSKIRFKGKFNDIQTLSPKSPKGAIISSKEGNNTINGGHLEVRCEEKWGQICVLAGDPEEEFCGEWHVVGQDCYEVWVEDPDPDPCYDENYLYICENPEEPPVMGCDNVLGSGAYMAECGCIGGTTNITECPEDDPCAKKGMVDGQAGNSNNSLQRDTILANMGTYEYGAEQKLNSKDANSGFKQVTVRTDYEASSMEYNFTWGPNSGYTIGFIHSHPLGSAPSLEDIFTMAYSSAALRTNVSIADAQFYEARSSVTVVTTAGTYVATVKDWDAFRSAYTDFQTNSTAMNAEYLSTAAANGNSTAFSLLEMLGDSIYLYKAEAGTNNFKPMKIENGTLKTKNCP